MTQINWLRDVIKSTNAQRFNRKLDVLVTADHNDHRIRCERMNARHQLESAHSAHVDVADYEVECFVRERSERIFRGTCFRAVVNRTEQVDEQTPNLQFIVDDEKF